MTANPNLTLFISDIHLSDHNPQLTQLFIKFINEWAGRAGALYILGDLFEIWLGDDDDSELAALVSTHLSNLAQDGTRVYLMRGNRDIMLGEAFAAKCGALLVNDPSVIDLYGAPTLIMHGDSLCTLDVKHQQYRNFTLNPVVRWVFLHLPLWIRKKMADHLRSKSKDHQKQIGSQPRSHSDHMQAHLDILDVNPAEVSRVLEYYKVSQLIHGHVHKPSIHTVKYLSDLKTPATRLVLGDWGDLGSVLICMPDGFELQVFSA